MSAQSHTETPQVVRPKAIDTAFLLAVVGIVLYATGMVLNTLVDREHLVRFIRETLSGAGQPFTEDDVLRLVAPFRLVGGIGMALLAGLLILVAVLMRAGRNWARVLLTGFALLSMINFLGAVSSTGAAPNLIWNLGGVAFWVAAVIYLFRPESITFFTESRKRRR